jgi:sterol desaturase/sphingolipid hydroxylase (fatty acid hydroxylase superfamily)
MGIEQFVLQHEQTIRLGFFFGVFALVALWELASPQRVLQLTRRQRWTANMGLVFLNTVILRLVFPVAAVGVAALSAERGWGVLNLISVPYWLAVLLAVVAMDFVIWLQHVMVHALPALWRLHRVHHADLDYDLTTGARFHPLEIMLSMGIKFATIVLLGAPVLAVVVFKVLRAAPTFLWNAGRSSNGSCSNQRRRLALLMTSRSFSSNSSMGAPSYTRP